MGEYSTPEEWQGYAERRCGDAERRCGEGLRAILKLENLNAQIVVRKAQAFQLNMRGVLDYIEDWSKKNINISFANRKDMFIKFFDSPQTALLTFDICNVTRYDKQKLSDIFMENSADRFMTEEHLMNIIGTTLKFIL